MLGLVHTLLLRCLKTCSSMENFHLEVEQLRNIFKLTNLSKSVRFSSHTSAPVFENLLQYGKFSFRSRTAEKYFQIDQSIKKCLGNLYVHKQIIPTAPKKEFLIALPFLGKCCMTLRTCLYKSVSKTLSQCNIKVIFQSKNRLSNVLKFKDSIPYIFAPALVTNVSVVIAILVIVAKRVNNSKKSAVKDHCLLSDHVCSFDDFTVLTHDSHKFKCLIKESLLVTFDKRIFTCYQR